MIYFIFARIFRFESGQFIAELLKKKIPVSIHIPFIKNL